MKRLLTISLAVVLFSCESKKEIPNDDTVLWPKVNGGDTVVFYQNGDYCVKKFKPDSTNKKFHGDGLPVILKDAFR
jgi:hypothetical protein